MENEGFDVLVAGGGPAGITAALAAVRQGARTGLIERQNCLGGIASMGVPIATFHTRDRRQIIKGYPQEIVEKLIAAGGSLGHVFSENAHVGSMTPVYPEVLKYVCEKLLLEEGVKIHYHARVAGAIRTEHRVEGVVVADKNGIQEIGARCVVDCTGDGDVMGFAGVPYQKGRTPDGLMQSMTLMFGVAGVDTDVLREHFTEHSYFCRRPGEEAVKQIHYGGSLLRWHSAHRGQSPFRNDRPYLWAMCIRPGELILNLTDVFGLDGTRAEDLTKAEVEGRRQIFAIHAFLRTFVPGFASSYIASTASQIGVRETRRLAGKYILTREDILRSTRFDDAVCKGAYCFDMHDPEGKGTLIEKISPQIAYEIPYRSLIADGWEGFVAAGRCISTTHEAHAATRVMGTCMATGQAAGTAAAMSVDVGVATCDLDARALRKVLSREGAYLD